MSGISQEVGGEMAHTQHPHALFTGPLDMHRTTQEQLLLYHAPHHNLTLALYARKLGVLHDLWKLLQN